jgi:hypothetical protein
MTTSSNDASGTSNSEDPLATFDRLTANVNALLAQNTELRRLGQAIVDDRTRPLHAPSRRGQLVNDLADYLESIS